MKKLLAGMFVLITAFSTAAWADDEYEAVGTIKAVNTDKRTLTISHGPIRGLGMSAMTMDFHVADPAMLMDAEPGQKIKFFVSADRGGRYVVTDLMVESGAAFAGN